MQTLITNIDQLRAYVTTDVSIKFTTIKPYIEEAHQYVITAIGKTAFTALLDYVNTPLPDNADTNLLLEYCRAVVANFGIANAIPKVAIRLAETGVQHFVNTNTEPASEERIADIVKSLTRSGWLRREQLLQFVEENKSIYTDAYNYQFNNKLYINSATKVNELRNTVIEHNDFAKIKPSLTTDQDTYIVPEIGKTEHSAIINEIKNDNLTVAHQTLLDDYIYPFMSYRACFHVAMMRKETEIAHEYASQARKIFEQMRDYVKAPETPVRYNYNTNNSIILLGP